jgi:hypothetical protein
MKGAPTSERRVLVASVDVHVLGAKERVERISALHKNGVHEGRNT